MEAIVAFFEKLVSEFSWKRFAFILVLLILLLFSAITFESYTGQFRSTRMRFAAEHLKSLADPSVKEQVKGDKELEEIYQKQKKELLEFVSDGVWLNSSGALTRAFSASIPWLIVGISFAIFLKSVDRRNAILGAVAIAVPCVFLAVLLPAATPWWIVWLIYPWGCLGGFAAFAVYSEKSKKQKSIHNPKSPNDTVDPHVDSVNKETSDVEPGLPANSTTGMET